MSRCVAWRHERADQGYMTEGISLHMSQHTDPQAPVLGTKRGMSTLQLPNSQRAGPETSVHMAWD